MRVGCGSRGGGSRRRHARGLPAASTAGTKHGHRHHHHHLPKFVVGPGNLVAPLTIRVNRAPGPRSDWRKPSIKCATSSARGFALSRRRSVSAITAPFSQRPTASHPGDAEDAARQTTLLRRHEVPLLLRTRGSPTCTSPTSGHGSPASGSPPPGRRCSRFRPPAIRTALRTCCSGSTPTFRTTCRSSSPRSGHHLPVKGGLTLCRTTKKENEDPRGEAYQTESSTRSSAPLLPDPRRATNSSLTPLDDFAGLELVKQWREDVWTHANQLIAAKTRRSAPR